MTTVTGSLQRNSIFRFIEVIEGGDVEEAAFTDVATGTLVNSGFLTGKSVEEAKKAIIEWLEEKSVGTKKTNFKLRDWVFSRQRYWGEPIPIVKCEKCGYVPIPEEELPLELPEVDNYMPTDNGESPIRKYPRLGRDNLSLLRWQGRA